MRKPYKSEFTKFLEEYKAAHPETEKRQAEGLALLWNKSVDRDFQKAAQKARVDQKPYVYLTASPNN